MISAGNFHGEPLALALDLAAMSLAEIGSISERRTFRMLTASLSELPPFLTSDSGLNNGYMIAQYTAAALVAENKVLCHPASVDSIPSSGDQEDHVSMGMTAALKLLQVARNVRARSSPSRRSARPRRSTFWRRSSPAWARRRPRSGAFLRAARSGRTDTSRRRWRAVGRAVAEGLFAALLPAERRLAATVAGAPVRSSAPALVCAASPR